MILLSRLPDLQAGFLRRMVMELLGDPFTEEPEIRKV